jgi:soluble lytic murein transglycosylase-like protein
LWLTNALMALRSLSLKRVLLAGLATLALSPSCLANDGDCLLVVDSDPSVLVLSNRPLDPAACAGRSQAAPAPALTGADPALHEIVRQAARDNALDPALLHAVIATESAYARRAVSPRGALGLMQLMPATAREYGVTDAFDARQNVRAGALHLRRLLDRFDQDTRLALAAYNAGAAAVQRHGGRVPPFAETRAYVPRVLRLAAAQAGPR